MSLELPQAFQSVEGSKIRPEFPAVWDSTMRSTAALCLQKFYIAHILNLRPKEDSIHLVAGAAFAKGVETVRWEYFANKRSLDEALELGIIALLAEYGDFAVDPEDKKSPESMCEALIGYFDNYKPDFDIVKPHFVNGKPCVEFSFAIPLPDVFHPVTRLPILYAGRFDMVGVFQDSLFGVDEKTASQLGESWARQWDLRGQFIGYTWAARHFGLPVSGFLVRGVGLYKSKPRVRFAQQFVSEQEYKIELWLKQIKRDIERAKRAWEEGYFDYALDYACSAYGECVYKQLCLVKNKEPWYSSYKYFKWDPLQINKVKDKPWRFA